MSEIVVEEKERVSFDRIGGIFLSEWRFKKNRVYKDGDGEVTLEQPFEETAFSLSKLRNGKWSSIWLSSSELRDVANLLEGNQKLV